MKTAKKAELILENGMRFEGKTFGHVHDVVGEVIFTTGMVGYQEEITDPAFCGQILVKTYPLIGNYGINFEDMESDKPAITALVVREK
ncbi:MAG: carbamoyl-phosphate synthase domain-containing protein, partial [Oscillospiraceae bacterium]